MESSIKQFPVGRLPFEEEARLAKAAKRGDQDAANKLVMATMREALLYTGRVSHGLIDDAERISICYRRLMECVQKFDPKYKIRFFAFSKAALRGQMKDYWKSRGAVRNATKMVSVDLLEGWTYPHVRRVFPHNEPLPSEDDDCGECLRELTTGEIENPNMEAIYNRDRWHEVEKLVAHRLTEQQRMVLSLVYKSGLNFQEIGKLFDQTRSHIHAIHKGAIKLIRDILARKGRLLE